MHPLPLNAAAEFSPSFSRDGNRRHSRGKQSPTDRLPRLLVDDVDHGPDLSILAGVDREADIETGNAAQTALKLNAEFRTRGQLTGRAAGAVLRHSATAGLQSGFSPLHGSGTLPGTVWPFRRSSSASGT